MNRRTAPVPPEVLASALTETALSMGRMIARTHAENDSFDASLAAWSALLYTHLLEGRVYLDITNPYAGLELSGPRLPPLSPCPDWLEEVEPDRPSPSDCPLIVSDERLWFARYYDFDRRLRAGLASRRVPPARPMDEERLAHDLRSLFPELARTPSGQGQGLAAAHLVDLPFGLLTGGPGTGKTTSLAKMLLLRLRQLDPAAMDPIYLLAPTGKAATRLRQSLAAAPDPANAPTAMDALRASLRQAPELLALLPGIDPGHDGCRIKTMTIHKALGVRRDRREGQGPFWSDRDQPLKASMVIVDEVSMVDLALMTRLVEAVPVDAPLILVGDAEQLKSVEAGPVLSELADDQTPLTEARRRQLATRTGIETELNPDNLRSAWHIRLTRNYRFGADSIIGQLAAAINRGDADSARGLLEEQSQRDGGEILWLKLPEDGHRQHPQSRDIMLAPWAYGRLRALLTEPGRDPGQAVAAFDQFRVLCAMRGGPDGADRWNERLSDWVAGRPAADHPRAVMISVNDPVSGLCNGDTGLILPHGLIPQFHSSDGLVWPAALLPAHEPGWAITIHKSQGSEVDTAAIVLPREGGERLLTRRLLYTAITRARRRVILFSSEAALQRAIVS